MFHLESSTIRSSYVALWVSFPIQSFPRFYLLRDFQLQRPQITTSGSMRFRLLSLCAVLLAATQAAPTTADLQARKSINDCEFSTFENQSTDGSPLIADCEKIVSNIARTLPSSVPLTPKTTVPTYHILTRERRRQLDYRQRRQWSLPARVIRYMRLGCQYRGQHEC
jgi:hypothetical protein